MLYAQPRVYMSLYTLTIFSKVTSTHTTVMMPENYRTLRPVNSKTSPRNHMKEKEVGGHASPLVQANIIVPKNFVYTVQAT